MSETTRIFVPDGGNNDLTALAAMNGMGGGAWANNPIWALAFLGIFANGFGNWGGNGNNSVASIQEQLNTIQGNNALMAAIQGGTNEVRSLANVLNADVNSVQAAINGVQSAICNVGNSVGMNSMQVVNAIQAGNTAIANQIATCCCENKQLVQKMGYENQINNLQQSQLISNGFSQIGYAAAENACAIKQAILDQTIAINGKIDAQESARKDREINALTAQLSVVNARAERAAELAPIYKALEEIKGKQPSTAVVQYPNLVGIPAYQLYGGYGYPFNYNNGQWS